MNKEHVVVIGGGAWGTALASLIASNVGTVSIIVQRDDIADEINRNHTNQKYLPDIRLASNIAAYTGVHKTPSSQIFIIAVPTAALKSVVEQIGEIQDAIFILCSKGIDSKTLKLPTQIVADLLPAKSFGVLFGPNFAKEVSRKKHTAATLAIRQPYSSVAAIFNTYYFQVEWNEDIIGVQVLGSVKNAMAIGAGIIQGLDKSKNTLAAFISAAAREAQKLSVAAGGQADTINTAAGIGDLVLSCHGIDSRNAKFGYQVAESLDTALKGLENTTVEGYYNLKALDRLALKSDLSLPILKAIYNIVYLEHHPGTLLRALMQSYA